MTSAMTSSISMMLNASTFPVRSAFFFYLLVALLSACDPGKVSTCVFVDEATCHASSSLTEPSQDGGSPADDMPQSPSIPTTPIFAEIMRFHLDPSQQFAGLYNNESIIKEYKNNKRNMIRVTRSPDTPGMGYTTDVLALKIVFPEAWWNDSYDKIFFAGSSAYFVQYDPTETNVYSSDGNRFISARTDLRGPDLRAFFNSKSDAFAVSALSGRTTSIHIQMPEGMKRTIRVHETSRKLSTYVIGDLDAIDNNHNGLEFISLADDGVETVKHQTMTNPNNSDTELANALGFALHRPSGGLSIKSAYIIDINNDKFMDILYSIGGTMQAVTYLGRTGSSSGPAFQAWSASPLPKIVGTEILSINPININGDLFSDLVIEIKGELIYFENTLN